MGATSSPEMTLDQALHVARAEGLISLAGLAAEKRALRGSPGGWRKFLSRDTLKAHHEAGHAVIALSFGRYVYGASIETDVAVRLKGGVLGGFAFIGHCPEPSGGPAAPILTDRQTAAKFARFMDERPTWRSTLRHIRAWRSETEALIEERWAAVIALAFELEQRRTMNQSEIAAVMSRFR